MIRVRLNGDERELPDGASVADLIAELGLRPELVAVERNQELVPRANHATTRLAADDRIEVVTLVGGG